MAGWMAATGNRFVGCDKAEAHPARSVQSYKVKLRAVTHHSGFANFILRFVGCVAPTVPVGLSSRLVENIYGGRTMVFNIGADP